MRVCVGGASERKGWRGKRLRTKVEAQLELALSTDLKTLPPNAPLSLPRVTQRTAKHMRQQVLRCVLMGVDCMNR